MVHAVQMLSFFLDNFSLKVSESGHFEVHIKKRKRKLQKRKERVEIKSAFTMGQNKL